MTTATAVVIMLFAVASAAVSTAVTSVASAAMTSAAATASVYELAVEALCELLLSSLAYCEDLACEVERLACHLVVDVDLYNILKNFEDCSWSHAAHLVYERNDCADYHEVVSHFAVDHEC